ncbi:hypothetical protein G3I60_40175 [Streptomyces sp. SID13666]|uniref:hypothetical protein n=1 Tax=Streptomyces sp. SID13666 TaxID=2706054 RepID=UPI0013C297F1|nr:hypothetical protein [Streptomyces sp. SID13666]NEA60220.1 hypothetical protein [Streptomyces sp. SID13666]
MAAGGSIPAYEPLLAKAYHVTEKDLLVAQDRSFGIAPAAVPAGPSMPETLAGRSTFLLGSRFAADEVPGDAEIMGRINAGAGRQLLSAAEFGALRSGERELADLLGGAADRVVFLDGLGEVLGVSPMVFQSDDVVARQVVEGIQRLAASGQGFAMAARGAEEMGVSPQMLAALAAVLEQAERDRPGPQPN